MMEIPDSLKSLFTANIEVIDGEYYVKIPQREVDVGSLQPNTPQRIAVLPPTDTSQNGDSRGSRQQTPDRSDSGFSPDEPPVSEGDVLEVEITSTGDEGDGVAKIDRGFVVMVEDARVGDEPFVEITNVQENVAFAQVTEPPEPHPQP